MTPNYHSINSFRKDNPKALRNLFKLFVSFLKDVDLVEGEAIAIDGTMARANNSKKSNYSQKKIDRHIAYIDNKVDDYIKGLEETDVKENHQKVTNVLSKTEKLKDRKIYYELLENQL